MGKMPPRFVAGRKSLERAIAKLDDVSDVTWFETGTVDVTFKRGEHTFVVDLKAGDPADPLPSGTGFHMQRRVAEISDSGERDVRGVVVTNYRVPTSIREELQGRGISLLGLSEELGLSNDLDEETSD